jgi:hypothetical protein
MLEVTGSASQEPRMTNTSSVIRLLGGPPGLADCHIDLAADPSDQADASERRFVRATRDSMVTSLARLQSRCVDRATTEHLAATWRLAVFVRAGRLSTRTRRYRFEGRYPLEAVRDETGRWMLRQRSSEQAATPAPRAADQWSSLERAVDEAAIRFAAVAGLLPDGPMAERALATRLAVGTCVNDAARLCAVGATVAPLWPDDAGTSDPERMADVVALAERVAGLVDTIEVATSQLVSLHLEVGDDADPVTPVASLAAAWNELPPSPSTR